MLYCLEILWIGSHFLPLDGFRKATSTVSLYIATTTIAKGAISLMSNSITQDMRYRQSLMHYAEKYGVSRASRKYNKSRSYIYFWKIRWDGSVESLACRSRRPTMALTLPTGFPIQNEMSPRSLKPLPKNSAYAISSSGRTHPATTAK